MLGVYGCKTKRDLKARVGQEPPFVETSLFGAEYRGDGSYPVVGPDAYRDRRWYATVIVKGGVIAKVS